MTEAKNTKMMDTEPGGENTQLVSKFLVLLIILTVSSGTNQQLPSPNHMPNPKDNSLVCAVFDESPFF
jgi:hypothetical protein